MSTHRDLLAIFGSVQRVMRAEKEARSRGLDVDAIPAPRTVSSDCGVALEARREQAAALAEALTTLGLEPQQVYRRDGDAWVPSSLDAVAPASATRLTRGSAYGGCGAKLAKGDLDRILCGLPRLESDDLLVGIEGADDAGVVRVGPDIALIHTADFFPPIVDDPFAFGRIAATNALSDVYAMGGEPLACMNLVCFPAGDHDLAVLKEILRGGLDAMKEAHAVLAGGHTIEGRDLLYGLAVTGTVHPDRIWRNGGAQPGDVLILTKPLGTGLVTTAAKADMTDPVHVSTALRWMGTSNRRAAEALRAATPHAVTDVTGFGLVGHAAEMAAASGVDIVLELGRLPQLPGALEAAATGLVPAGTGRNRRGVDAVLEVAPDADPVQVDLALDPQTSGGLLAALDPDSVNGVLLRLTGAAVVGRCGGRGSGRVRLVP